MSTYISVLARQTGKKIVDAKKGLILKVTSKDIDKAEQNNPSACGFAQAATRQLKATSAHFFRSVAWVETPRHIVRFSLPQSMQKEIVAFDRSKSMEPGTYKLSPVWPGRRPSERRKYVAKVAARKSHAGKGIRKGVTRFKHTSINVRIVPKAAK